MSIQSHSKPSSKLVIFSVYNYCYRSERMNNLLHEDVLMYLIAKGIECIEVNGSYLGITEKSIVVDQVYIDRIKAIAESSNQDSILLLDEIGAHGTRKAHLQYMDSRPTETIGWLRESTREAAMAMQDYSYNPKTGKYYIVESDYTKASQIQ